MIKNKLLTLLFIFLAIASNYFIKCDEGFFTVVGGFLLKHHQLYRVSVAYQGYKKDKILRIGIMEVDKFSGCMYHKNVVLNGDGIQNIEFDVSKTLKI